MNTIERLRALELALHSIRHNLRFAIAFVVTLSLSLIVTTIAFSVLYGVLLKPLPYPNEARIVELSTYLKAAPAAQQFLTAKHVAEVAGGAASLALSAPYLWGGATSLTGPAPVMLTTNQVTSDFFQVFGVPPQLGRVLSKDDAPGGPIVLSHRAWQQLLGGRADVIGSQLVLKEGSREIIGVMPAAFAFPSGDSAYWERLDESTLARDPGLYANANYVQTIALLAPGVAPEQVTVELKDRSRVAFSEVSEDRLLTLRPTLMKQAIVSGVQPTLIVLLVLALLVLAIAASHVAHLVSAHTHGRLNELALREVLGTPRRELECSVIIAVLLLALLAALLSVALAHLGLGTVLALDDSGLPRAAAVGINLWVMGFSLICALSAAAGAMHGALKRWRRLELNALLKELSARQIGQRLVRPRILPTLALGLSLAAVTIALLLAQNLARLNAAPLGYQPEGIAVLQLFLDDQGDNGPARARLEAARMREALRAVPGVLQVSQSNAAPMGYVAMQSGEVTLLSAPSMVPLNARFTIVEPDYFALMQRRILAGRALNERDDERADPAVVINQALAKKFFGDGNAIGGRISLPPFGNSVDAPSVHTIVGVAEDALMRGLRFDGEPEVIAPGAQLRSYAQALLVRTQGDPRALLEALNAAVWKVNPRQGVYLSYALADTVAERLAAPRFFARITAGFALLALALALLGVYSVIAFGLAQRRAEFALRAALGASPLALAWEVLLGALKLALAGAVVGVAATWAINQLLRASVFGLEQALLPLFVISVLALLFGTVVAVLGSALGAARVNPLHALR